MKGEGERGGKGGGQRLRGGQKREGEESERTARLLFYFDLYDSRFSFSIIWPLIFLNLSSP